MKKLILLTCLLIFACSSDLFAQDYKKLSRKKLRIEHQKKLNLIDSLSQELNSSNAENLQKLNLIDSLSQELNLSNKKSQNLQSDLNNTSSDLMLTSDSLKNSNLEITQLEAKLLISKNELSLLGSETDNLVKESSDKTNLISDKNLQIDSLRTSLINISTEKTNLVSKDSLKTTIITRLEKDKEELLVTLQNEEKDILELEENFNKSKIKKLFLIDEKTLKFYPIQTTNTDMGNIGVKVDYAKYDIFESEGKYWLLNDSLSSMYLISSVILDKILDIITINLDGYAEELGEDNYPFQVPVEKRKIIIRRMNGKYYFKNDTKSYVVDGNFKWIDNTN